jgi:hypothetical protein
VEAPFLSCHAPILYLSNLYLGSKHFSFVSLYAVVAKPNNHVNMISSYLYHLVCFFFFVPTLSRAQSTTSSGYTDYSFSLSGDPDSVIYETASTPANASTTFPQPDVYLNASVYVGEIDLNVSNLTAKINLDAQVLELLQFNAGVDVSIDRVSLLIQNVSAKVVLEARLANLVLMIDDVLSSIDLNPVIATLGQDIGNILNTTVGGLATRDSNLGPLSYNLANNILYSINDYSGHTHTNRILAQNGSIVDESLDNDGKIYSRKIVGDYSSDMTFTGYNQSVTLNGEVDHELEYVYTPFNGINVISAIYIDTTGKVVATQVLSESCGGGTSTVGGP